jgi:5-formyltetrahydrofolate cyclo-ligase
MPPHDKAYFRQAVKQQIAAMDGDNRLRANHHILARLRDLPVYRAMKAVLFYHPMADEVDLTPLIRENCARGLSICLPLCLADTCDIAIKRIANLNDLRPGPYGIMEPQAECEDFPVADLDGILTPGRAFDKSGHRIGRGAGYYDRFFKTAQAVKIAAAFSSQIFPEIPVEPHDIPVDFIITEEQIIECGSGGQ